MVGQTTDWGFALIQEADDCALVRQDCLPEHNKYPDSSGGCRINRTCLDCPRERCVLDDGGDAATFDKALRNLEIARKHEDGTTAALLADWYQLSERTIHRVLSEVRAGTTARQIVDGINRHPEPATGFHPTDWAAGIDDELVAEPATEYYRRATHD